MMFFEKRKRKRKNEEWYGTPPRRPMENTLIIAGAVFAMLVAGGLILFGVSGLGLSHPAYPTPYTNPRFQNQIVFIDTAHYIHNGTQSGKQTVCKDLTVSPDRQSQAMICIGMLELVQGDKDTVLDKQAGIRAPAFNRDGTAIHYLVDFDKDELNHSRSYSQLMEITLKPEISAPRLIATVRHSLVPPIAHPSTGWLLIAEPNDDRSTTISTIRDTPCLNEQDCANAKNTIAVVRDFVTAADFQPSGTALYYTDDQTLYALSTANGASTSILTVRQTTNLAFNQDGKQLAVLNQAGNLSIFATNNPVTSMIVASNQVQSFAWVD